MKYSNTIETSSWNENDIIIPYIMLTDISQSNQNWNYYNHTSPWEAIIWEKFESIDWEAVLEQYKTLYWEKLMFIVLIDKCENDKLRIAGFYNWEVQSLIDKIKAKPNRLLELKPDEKTIN